MAENTEGGSPVELSFKIKASKTHNITISDSATVLELKAKLSGEEYENVAADRMRLIYSGHVLKNEEPLSKYKIKNGNTVHMVKSAASNPTPASAASSSASAQAAVPPNMSAGTSASNPLDNLVGARYAGFAGLPSADLFGPNGGMGAPPSPEDIADMFSNPQTAQAMNEALNNPDMIDMMIQNNPMLRNMPNAREVLQSQLPAIRQLMSNPEAMRSMLRMRALFEGAGAGGGGFPSPGATDTTPANEPSTSPQGTPNPFAGLFGAGSLANPFGAQPPPYARSASASTTSPASGTPAAETRGAATVGEGAQPQGASGNPPATNPFAALLQAMGGGTEANAGAGGIPPFQINPQAMQNIFENMGLTAHAPSDNRPPEERYAHQLRQLNDMGFTDFERNVAALRRSGGSVQGAIEDLLSG